MPPRSRSSHAQRDAPRVPGTSSDDDDEYWTGLKHDEQDSYWDEDACETGAVPSLPESSDSEQDGESVDGSDNGTGSGYWSADESPAESECNTDDHSEHDPEDAEDARYGTGSDLGSESDTSTDNSDDLWGAVHDSECDDDWWAEACVLADAQNDDERDYVVGVGRETGPMSRWSRAASASQGYPGGHVRRVRPLNEVRRPHRRARKAAWVVFAGLQTGIFDTWEEVEALTRRVSNSIHKGFPTRFAAEQAYRLAHALNHVRTIRPAGVIGPPPPPFVPLPPRVYDALSRASDQYLGAEWHVVFRGRTPGVYPAW
ncbi:hypothetical protein HWV62_5191 [Athelia sp. TMB]|nr:hypothetical protein HWV62_5191 [Athelia sp. TMB]